VKVTSCLFPLIATLAIGCSGPDPQAASDTPPIAVAIGRAELRDLPSTFEAGGVIRARATASIASRIMAPVLDVHVRAGDRVRAGATLITLDSREVAANRTRAGADLARAVEALKAAEAEIQSSEAALVLARAMHTRIRALQEQRSATAQELDQAVAALNAAEAQVTGARARSAAALAAREAARAASDATAIAASYAVLTAPFDGVVSERSVDPGSMANPGVALLTVEDTSGFRLEVPVDQSRASGLTVGQTVDVAISESNATTDRLMAGRISEVARIDPSSHSFLIKLDVPDDRTLRSGVFGRARFSGPASQTLTIPSAAAVRRGQLTFVFTVDRDGRARLRPISPGRRAGERTEVLAGVRAGDRVIDGPPSILVDGSRVRGEQR
jgi:RND family efflux transporter MFP subunit